MKKNLIIIAFFVISIQANAQSFFGSQFDNYAGIYSVINNPANIADSRYRTDVNIGSASAFVENDYYAFQLSDAINGDFEENSTKYPTNSNNFYTNIDALLPSFQMNLNDKSAIAFFTRARSIAHLTEIDGIYLEDIQDEVEQDYSVKNQNFSLAFNTWAEVGLSYARVLVNNEKHYLKGGLSLKYLYGINSGYIKANNVSVDFDYVAAGVNGTNATGQIETGNVESFDDITSPSDNRGSGFGTDLGFTYELRTEKTNVNDGKGFNKYLLKFGISITDIGGMKYKEGSKKVYNGTGVTVYSNDADFDTYFQEDVTKRTNSFTVTSPTALHINADLKMNKKLYLNFNTDLNMIDKTKGNSNFINNTVSLTPRFETKWLSLYLPMSVLQYSGFQTGFGFRVGPLTVGSGSVITGLLGDSKAIDVHVGLRVPIYQKTK